MLQSAEDRLWQKTDPVFVEPEGLHRGQAVEDVVLDRTDAGRRHIEKPEDVRNHLGKEKIKLRSGQAPLRGVI